MALRLGWIPPIAVLAIIEWCTRVQWIPAHLLPPPSTIVQTLWGLGWNGLYPHLVASSVRVAVGFSLGAAFAVVLGSAAGLSRRIEELIDPSFQALRAIPSLAWVPLLLLWLGIDEASKITLIAIGAFFPVYLGVFSGLRNVDRKLIEVGLVYGMSPLALIRRVLLPSALPAVWTGLRSGLSLAWMFMVAAELIAATRGLGYLLTDGRETGRTDIVFSAILLLALLGQLSDNAMKQGERVLLRWRDTLHRS